MSTANSTPSDALRAHSDRVAEIVDKLGAGTVAVLGRRGAIASGCVWRAGLVVTAAHVFRRTPAALTLLDADERRGKACAGHFAIAVGEAEQGQVGRGIDADQRRGAARAGAIDQRERSGRAAKDMCGGDDEPAPPDAAGGDRAASAEDGDGAGAELVDDLGDPVGMGAQRVGRGGIGGAHEDRSRQGMAARYAAATCSESAERRSPAAQLGRPDRLCKSSGPPGLRPLAPRNAR